MGTVAAIVQGGAGEEKGTSEQSSSRVQDGGSGDEHGQSKARSTGREGVYMRSESVRDRPAPSDPRAIRRLRWRSSSLAIPSSVDTAPGKPRVPHNVARAAFAGPRFGQGREL